MGATRDYKYGLEEAILRNEVSKIGPHLAQGDGCRSLDVADPSGVKDRIFIIMRGFCLVRWIPDTNPACTKRASISSQRKYLILVGKDRIYVLATVASWRFHGTKQNR